MRKSFGANPVFNGQNAGFDRCVYALLQKEEAETEKILCFKSQLIIWPENAKVNFARRPFYGPREAICFPMSMRIGRDANIENLNLCQCCDLITAVCKSLRVGQKITCSFRRIMTQGHQIVYRDVCLEFSQGQRVFLRGIHTAQICCNITIG